MKPLKDILKGVKSSKIEPTSTGSDPGVDYAPKASKEQNWLSKYHKTEKHADRAGNDDIPYKSDLKQAVLSDPKHGHRKPNDKAVYEAMSTDSLIAYHKGRHERIVGDLKKNPKDKNLRYAADTEYNARTALKKLGVTVTKPKHPSVFEEKKCNMTEEGTWCPMHENAACSPKSGTVLKEKGKVN